MLWGIDNQLVGGVALVLAGGYVLVHSLSELSRARASRSWPAVDGIIEATGVDSSRGRTGTTFHPLVRYRYGIGDRQYVCDRIAFGGTVGSSFRFFATRRAERYGSAKTVRVFVCPEDPSLAVLEPGVPWLSPLWIAIGAGFLVAGGQTLLVYHGWLETAWVSF
jgi:hypothetical protein